VGKRIRKDLVGGLRIRKVLKIRLGIKRRNHSSGGPIKKAKKLVLKRQKI